MPSPSPTSRMPAVFLPHGGGPWPFMDPPMGEPEALARLTTYLQGLKDLPPEPPRAVLVVSAHWEEPVPTVMTAEKPPLFFDYSGFPAHTYELTWPAPGAPTVAARVRELLGAAGIDSAEDATRGFDHGTFVPLMLTWPEADVPVVQLSLKRGLDPQEHLAIGRALAPLLDEGVLLLGSGMSFHNMQAFFRGGATERSRRFDDWLAETVALPQAERERRLVEWESGPEARFSHPREEHLLPLMVIAGAAGAAAGSAPYRDQLLGTRILAAHFA